MAVDLDLLGQELERWAAMGSVHVGSGEAASPTSDSSTDAGPVVEAATDAPPQKPKKKRVRRQREELLYLRKKARQLEDDLERLKQSEDGHLEIRSSASSLWEGIANRQLQVRCESEDENRRLKRMLENQLTLARRFECFLQGSNDQIGAAPFTLGTQSSHPGDCGTRYEDLIGELKTLYLTVDQILPLVGPVTVTPNIDQAQVMDHPGFNGVIIQWPTNVDVPFDWAITARGIWRCIANNTIAISHVDEVEDHVVSEDTVIRSQTIRIGEGNNSQWRSHQVVQRFMEAERTVIVARSVWVSLDTTPSRLHDARFEETMRLVVCRSTDGGNAASVKGLVQMLPTCSRKADTGALTELVMRSMESNMRAMWPAVQSALIQEDLTQEDWHTAVLSI